MRRSFYFVTLLTACGLTGCGGQSRRLTHKPPPDATFKPSDPSRANPFNDSFEAPDQEWGSLPEHEIQQVMQANISGFNACFQKAAGRYVSGRVDTRFIIGIDGRVRDVFVARSSLGSWRVEDCLIQTARFFEFPPPQGGRNARFDYPFTWNPSGARLTRPVDQAWGYPTLRKQRHKFQACRRNHQFDAPLRLTVYVGRKGRPLSVGFDSDTSPTDGFAGCIVQLVQTLTFPNPGARSVKYQALVEDLPDA